MSERPRRHQAKRAKGWTKPDGAIYVGRPSRWGNPYHIGRHGVGQALVKFRRAAHAKIAEDPDFFEPLRGRDLVCWCKPEDQCHADILLDLANRPRRPAAPPLVTVADEGAIKRLDEHAAKLGARR